MSFLPVIQVVVPSGILVLLFRLVQGLQIPAHQWLVPAFGIFRLHALCQVKIFFSDSCQPGEKLLLVEHIKNAPGSESRIQLIPERSFGFFHQNL